ncbi:Inner membrane metabolite transport protein YhjE [Pseudonocardia autotrophica]|uniref:Putative proline/betaine transporter n=1 Tax=Pseudonocardia autotrophica TaxID=2074 RepID=A0A1Y2MUL0_PSEAH|nr:MFS transporter [Pseudonocardia autotrophica]OSY38855.1 Inner membrane metabolite transport protein YhjE [Pseudonocardia autotrophica]
MALAGLIGTTIEWYDFFIYGMAAALVFAPQFFPGASPVAGTLAALSTFAIGFVARPIGGALMGHFGDRVGRRSMLVLSLLIMGVGTLLIGLLPTYATIGIAAPILLVVLRFAQGIGVGGEWGGATLLALEHAPPSRRTLYSSFPQVGLPLGVVLASLVFLLVRLSVDEAAFVAWGWRIPFLISAGLVVFGLVLRLKLDESPQFTRVRSREQVRRSPLGDVLRAPRTLLPASGINIVVSGLANIMLVFTLSYVATRQLVGSSAMLAITVVTALVWAGVIPLAAMLAERHGRRPLLLAGAGLLTVWAFPYFWLIDTGSVAGVLTACVVTGIGVAIASGPYGAYIAEAFPTAVRYSGSSVAYAIGGVLGGAIAPIVATALFAVTGNGTAISAYVVVLGLVSIAAVLLLRTPHPDVTDGPAAATAPTTATADPAPRSAR